LQDGAFQPTLVLSGGDFTLGLAVDEIIDMVEARVEIELASEFRGVRGSALIGGEPVEIIDVAYYLELGRARMGTAALDRGRPGAASDAAKEQAA
jgi:two-component system chemotaxis sensor kinase CheA